MTRSWSPQGNRPGASAYALRAVVVLLAAVLVYLLQLPGLVIGVILVMGVFMATRPDPESPELTSLRTSVRLSAEDIKEVVNAYDTFLYSPASEHVTDRTVQRPKLANPHSSIPAIQSFQFHYHHACRFLNRLEPRLLNPRRSARELEQLLALTDERAATLRTAWWHARQAAQRHSPKGTDKR
ncbi:hypothetical protein LH392_07115 [Corynebacterium uberis]|uniref:hypothetical protein n=1 Tax=Corynebacterium uberis TaxID=2883169 RepID=UPI001D0B10A2|nr:hypothetical protein [Corynebacterium uberis]UDL79465.1 hypothetical protein LH392_07115 [Corynebacterium uberis]